MIGSIAATGARCPLGLTSLQVAMCLRARKLEPRALPLLDKRKHEVSLCFTGGLAASLHGYYRMIKLAAPALKETMASARDALPWLADALTSEEEGPKIPALLCAPEAGRPDDDPRFESEILREIAEASGFPMDLEQSAVIRKDQAGFADALVAAKALLDGGTLAVAVGGVDSYHHPEVLRWLDEACRLHTPEAENGFIPSEAAAWLLLTRDQHPVCCVHAEAGQESAEEDAPNIAATLTALVQQTKAAVGEPGWVICDLNNERHRANEFNMVRQRQLPYEATRSLWPIDTGDVGAASGPLFAAIADQLWRTGGAPAELAIMTLCSESVERAVVALRGPSPDQQEAMDPAAKAGLVPAAMPFVVTSGVPRLFAFERSPMESGADVRAPAEYVFEEVEDDDEYDDLEALPDNAYDTTDPIDDEVEGASDEQEEVPDLIPVDPLKRLAVLGGVDFSYPEMAPGTEGEKAQLRRLLRDCAEEIGGLWALRHLKPHELYRWDAMRSHEDRMVASLDAIVALGSPALSSGGQSQLRIDVLEEVMSYSRDAASVDPARAFARAFVLGNVAGDDTVRAAIVALKQSQPYTYAAQSDALSLGTNPAIVIAAERLLHEDDPRLIALGFDVLHARAKSSVAAAAPLVDHSRGNVRSRAARALGEVPEQAAAIELLVHLVEHEVDDDVAADGIGALILQGSAAGIDGVRKLLREELEEPEGLPEAVRIRMMELLALAGDARDVELLTGHFKAAPGGSIALGFHGHVAHVETLLGALEPGIQYAAAGPQGRRLVARALNRITGAQLLRRDRAGVARNPYDAIIDHDQWCTWWEVEEKRFDPQYRYRFGEPFSGIQLVDELERNEVPVDVRRLLGFELNALLGPGTVRLTDLSALQRGQLARARAGIVAGGATEKLPGGWLKLVW